MTQIYSTPIGPQPSTAAQQTTSKTEENKTEENIYDTAKKENTSAVTTTDDTEDFELPDLGQMATDFWNEHNEEIIESAIDGVVNSITGETKEEPKEEPEKSLGEQAVDAVAEVVTTALFDTFTNWLEGLWNDAKEENEKENQD